MLLIVALKFTAKIGGIDMLEFVASLVSTFGSFILDQVVFLWDMMIYISQMAGMFVGISLFCGLLSLPILIGLKKFNQKYVFKGWD